jgi:hypothetical protein
VSLSIRTILLVAGVVAVAWALASIASVLLVIFVSVFSIAVLSPVVTVMERRLGWSRGLCSAVLARRGIGLLIITGPSVLSPPHTVWLAGGRQRASYDRRPSFAPRSKPAFGGGRSSASPGRTCG